MIVTGIITTQLKKIKVLLFNQEYSIKSVKLMEN